MNHIREVIERSQRGESDRAIARDLHLSRVTVRKYRRALASLDEKGTAERLQQWSTRERQPVQTVSSVEPYRAVVAALLERGLEMRTIHDRLRADHCYTGSYSSVRRFVLRLRPKTPEVTVRVHTGPGEEAQVDFGSAGKFLDPTGGVLRAAYVFVMTLSYSRHQYAELVFDQKIPTWLGLHRRAFESFGGVPKRVVPDNLKAAVLEALVHDPVLGEGYRRLALHYGFLISPTRPATPQHKGKVESGVHYVQRNFLAGQEFVDIATANARLKIWVHEVAGTRTHGTTRQAPLRLFHDYEQAVLQPLPTTPFTLHQIKPVKVHPDCHVTLDGSYYSVPYRYIGQQLDAYVSDHLVELYDGVDLVVTHVRSTRPGQWQTRLEDYPPEKAAYLLQTPQYCRQWAAQIGASTSQVVDMLLTDKPLERLRAVQAILGLEKSVGRQRLEAACQRALHFGDVRYRRIKQILNAALDRDPLPEVASPPPTPGKSFTFARSSRDFFPTEPEGRPC